MPELLKEKDGHMLAKDEDIKYTTCYMCACRCGIKVTLKGDKIRYIQGNPAHPTNKGVICAKGSAGVMKQFSPARITKPLLRKKDAKRGDGDFDEISWDEAMDILVKRLRKIREDDPKKFAFFTGRDQMQALTSLFAKQFGTPNFAAHGGFCSVNMAAGMIYSIGGSSWEFGGVDYDRTKYMLLFGVAEDHDSNPLKLGISKVKERGGKVVVINPIRSGYGAIADEWVPIKPGTDGAFILALIHVLLKHGLYDVDFLISRTNASFLICMDEGTEMEGMPYLLPEIYMEETQYTVWDQNTNSVKEAFLEGSAPALLGKYVSNDGHTLKPAMQLLIERVMDEYTPEKASIICGVPVEQINRLALEIGITARDETITLPIPWTDAWGRKHKTTTGNPVAVHGMRGLAAHSNGFQTVRAFSLLMMLLGIVDRPGGFLFKPPFPKPVPPCPKPINSPEQIKPNTPLPAPELGFPSMPEHLMLDDNGNPLRIDKAFSWEFPLTPHGMIQNVITNAYNKDPYPIDTLMFFMANMSWNSTMNTSEVMKMLQAQDDNGEYKIPFIVVSDAFYSEQVAYSDLVLPDTTYLERYDVVSLLDRPICEYDAAADAIRVPILPPKGECRPFQQTLIDVANALGLPGFCDSSGKPLYKTYEEFITKWEPSPGAGVGFLAGWRGKNGNEHMTGEPNPNQLEAYIKNKSFFKYELHDTIKYNRTINQGYLNWAQSNKLIRLNDLIIMQFYSEALQRFRLSAKGLRKGRQPNTDVQRKRIIEFFDPLPFWYEPLEQRQIDKKKYTFHAITQRPMPMYHSWDSQNAWLRQIISQNFLYINTQSAQALGINDLDWVWVESPSGKIRVQVKLSQAVRPDTVWTWNGIGKHPGAWNLAEDADEAQKGFLLNHLIREEIDYYDNKKISNSDPITGQAAWYDLKVKITKSKESGLWPQFNPLKPLPHMSKRPKTLRYDFMR
ncbi:MAG: molybdopterin oxidoreductase family protein [Candidatus Magnetoovum sp. WYHC-5]|nr:molybdopterin oxidoreductase family protein [Candidatus Magnetoovum sp. WYHC-5]